MMIVNQSITIMVLFIRWNRIPETRSKLDKAFSENYVIPFNTPMHVMMISSCNVEYIESEEMV